MSSDEDTENSYESDEEVAQVEKRGRKGKKGKDPNKPKRNMSAFFLYSNAHRDRVKTENPGVKFGQIVSSFIAALIAIASVDSVLALSIH